MIFLLLFLVFPSYSMVAPAAQHLRHNSTYTIATVARLIKINREITNNQRAQEMVNDKIKKEKRDATKSLIACMGLGSASVLSALTNETLLLSLTTAGALSAYIHLKMSHKIYLGQEKEMAKILEQGKRLEDEYNRLSQM